MEAPQPTIPTARYQNVEALFPAFLSSYSTQMEDMSSRDIQESKQLSPNILLYKTRSPNDMFAYS